MEIREQVELAQYTTFGVGGPARWFVQARSEADVQASVEWAAERGVPSFVLGGGSNLLIRDEGFEGLILQMAIDGIERTGTDFEVGAGVEWDRFVDATIEVGCSGVECLAGIPGTVGGTPVQNVGAYGQEVSSTVERVRVWDNELRKFAWLSNAECGFAYRESIFNTAEKGRYIVTSVVFRLGQGAPTLKYAELAKKLEGTNPSLREVAEMVRTIRRGKGMVIDAGDPDSRSAGSFFKNPIVSMEAVERVVAAAGEVPKWAAGDGKWKLPAAWLLEHAGFVKGYGAGPVGISSKHTLALVNRGDATFADVMRMQEEIAAGVEQKFGVRLEREPVVLGSANGGELSCSNGG